MLFGDGLIPEDRPKPAKTIGSTGFENGLSRGIEKGRAKSKLAPHDDEPAGGGIAR